MTAISDLSTWGAESIHASFFVNAPHKVSPGELFLLAYGQEPETTNEASNPQFGKLGIASSLASEGRVRSVQLQPGRVDVVFHSAGTEITTGGFPELCLDIDESVGSICEAASKLPDRFAMITRVAVNVRLAKHSNELAEVVTHLRKALPTKDLDLGGVLDFVLQMNSRATVDGFELNRLVKWSAESVQVFADAFGQFTPGGPSQMLLREFWAAAVQFDFNTVVPGPIFSPEDARAALSAIQKTVIAARQKEIF